jgi:hypothetical protein
LWLTPAIVAGHGRSTLATIGILKDAVSAAPGRLVAYFAASAALTLAVGGALAALLWAASSQTLALAASAAAQPGNAGGLAATLVDLGLAALADGRTPAAADAVPLLIYVLYALALGAVVLTLPLLVFPVCAACAAYVGVAGAASLETPG